MMGTRFWPSGVVKLLLGMQVGLCAQTASALSIEDAYTLARSNDRQWRVAQARYRDAQESLPLAKGQLLPQVSLSASYTRIEQEQVTAGRASQQQGYPSETQAISLRQPLIRLRQWRAVEQARATTEQAQWILREEEQQLAVRVMTAYLDALLARDRRQLGEAQLSLVTNRLAAAQAGLRAGQGTRNDVDDATAELDRIKAQLILVDQGIQTSQRQLELLTGAAVSAMQPLDASRFDPARLEVPSLDAAVLTALDRNPQLLAAKQDVRAATSLLRQAEAGHLPTLDLVAQVGKSSGENSFFASTSTRSASVGIQFSLPLYAGGTIDAQARQATARLEQATEMLEQMANKIRLQVQTEHNAVIQGRSLLAALKTAVASAEQAVASSRRGQVAGVRTLLDVLRTESQKFQAELDLAQTRYSYLGSWIRLQALTGAMGETEVPRISALFRVP